MTGLVISPNTDIICMSIQNWLNKFLAADGICFSVDEVYFSVDSITLNVSILDCDKPCEDKR